MFSLLLPCGCLLIISFEKPILPRHPHTAPDTDGGFTAPFNVAENVQEAGGEGSRHVFLSELGLAEGELQTGEKLVLPCVPLICPSRSCSIIATAALPPPPGSPGSLLPLELSW